MGDFPSEDLKGFRTISPFSRLSYDNICLRDCQDTVVCHSRKKMERSRILTSIEFPSVNGWNTAKTFSAMSAISQTRGLLRTRLRHRNTVCTRCLQLWKGFRTALSCRARYGWTRQFYSVRKDDRMLHSDGKQLRGTSKNQYCISMTTDRKQTVFLVEGLGKPSQRKIWENFKDHIASSSVFHRKNYWRKHRFY